MALRLYTQRMLRLARGRGLCTVGSQKPAIGISAEELLSDPELHSLLGSQNKGPSDRVSDDATLRLALLSRLAAQTGRPVASDALGTLHSAEDMAVWFARSLRPSGAGPHARGIIRAAICGEDQEAVDMRIDLEREKVQEEFLKTVPGNLQLDSKTFRKPEERSVRGKKAKPKPHIVRKVRKSRLSSLG